MRTIIGFLLSFHCNVLIFVIRILFPVEILPSSPEAVFAESYSETSLMISWSKPLRKMETLTHYVVHISALSSFDRQETTEGPDNKTYFLPDVKVCFPSLVPYFHLYISCKTF
jgi:hypothetical protein